MPEETKTTETEFIRKRWRMSAEQWFYGLVSAFITGGATALTTQGGLAIAQTVGSEVQLMDFTQWVTTALCSGFFGAAAYLKQSPLPKLPEGATQTTTTTTTTTMPPVPPTSPKDSPGP